MEFEESQYCVSDWVSVSVLSMLFQLVLGVECMLCGPLGLQLGTAYPIHCILHEGALHSAPGNTVSCISQGILLVEIVVEIMARTGFAWDLSRDCQKSY